MRQQPIHAARNDKPAEEIQVVDVGSALGYGPADCTDESDDVDQDTADVGCVAPPVEAEGVEIRSVRLGGVEVFDLQVAFADEVVIADDNPRDGGEEDRVGA